MTISTEPATAYRFLCGADMAPNQVHAAYPGATFVARARLDDPADRAIWGILLRIDPPTSAEGDTVRVVTDDGRPFAALAPGGTTPSGETAAIVAEARYWELPPSYVARLAGASDEDELS